MRAVGCISESIEWLGHGQSDWATGARFPTVAEITLLSAASTQALDPTHYIPGGFFRGVNSLGVGETKTYSSNCAVVYNVRTYTLIM
jgi:hypothetical protein